MELFCHKLALAKVHVLRVLLLLIVYLFYVCNSGLHRIWGRISSDMHFKILPGTGEGAAFRWNYTEIATKQQNSKQCTVYSVHPVSSQSVIYIAVLSVFWNNILSVG